METMKLEKFMAFGEFLPDSKFKLQIVTPTSNFNFGSTSFDLYPEVINNLNVLIVRVTDGTIDVHPQDVEYLLTKKDIDISKLNLTNGKVLLVAVINSKDEFTLTELTEIVDNIKNCGGTYELCARNFKDIIVTSKDEEDEKGKPNTRRGSVIRGI